MYRLRWRRETGSWDELWLGQYPLVWVALDLSTHYPALVNPKRTFADLLCVAQAEYPLPHRQMSGDRFATNSTRGPQYMHITDAAWMPESESWIAATDGSVRAARPASDDGPYEPSGMGARVLLAHLGAMLEYPPLAAHT